MNVSGAEVAHSRREVPLTVSTTHARTRTDVVVEGGVAANFLTNDALDTLAGIPECKAGAVRIEPPGTPTRQGRRRVLAK